MQNLSQIQEPIAAELAAFEQNFKEQIKSKIFLLNTITNYIVKRKGKQIRPTFVFLAALAAGGIHPSTYRGAGLIELLHTATLVHDDVVDESNYRRGYFSINALWKNKVAVLVGDYLLSRGLLLAVDNGDFDLLKLVSEAVKEMSEGELLQIEKARRLDITEEVYYEIIRQKTATLIAACCAVGAASAGADPEKVVLFKEFGSLTGIAFQIKDDLFDYGSEDVGKPLGIDIKEKKMTLPLIYALNKADWWKRRHIINIVKNHSDKPAKVKEVIQFVWEMGGVAYATSAMMGYTQKALELLDTLPENQAILHLKGLVNFTVNRKN